MIRALNLRNCQGTPVNSKFINGSINPIFYLAYADKQCSRCGPDIAELYGAIPFQDINKILIFCWSLLILRDMYISQCE